MIEEIEDPWHSRPIDVHRWSDHPEVVQFVDKVWDEYLPQEVVGKPGPKPKMAFRKQLRVLILDLYVAWLEDPELSIGVSMSAVILSLSRNRSLVAMQKNGKVGSLPTFAASRGQAPI